jgi:hypothetical protein
MGYSYGFGYGHTWRGKRRTVYGGAGLLAGETDGFATDFFYAVDAKRVAVKATNVVTNYGLDSFYQNVGTSPKQVWDVAGVLGWSPHNYVLQSQTFDNASWTKTLCTVGANAVAAPDGTTTADAVIPNAGSNIPIVQNVALSVIATAPYTHSVYVKNGTLGNNWFILDTTSSTTFRGWFNLATGVKGTSTGSPISYNMTNVGNGWYRVDITFPAGGSTAAQCSLKPVGADGSVVAITGDGTSPALYVWGAQLNRGTVPTAYLPTTTTARYGLAVDYDPVTHAARGLWTEPAATNLHLYSTDQTAIAWIQSSATVARDVVAPNGLVEGTTITEVAATTQHSILSNSGYRPALTAVPYAFSVFLKAGTRRYVNISIESSGNGFNVTVDTQAWAITNGVATGTGWTYTSSSLQNVGGGWYRVTILGTPGVSNTIFYIGGNTTPTGGRSESYLGNGSTIICWGVQIETGSIASSPVPTFAASVTRAGDGYQFLLNTIPALGSEYSMYLQYSTPLTGQTRYPFIIGNAGNTDFAAFREGGATNMLVTAASVNQVSINATGATVANTIYKVAARIKLNDFATAGNGGTVVTDTVGTLPTGMTSVGVNGGAGATGVSLAPYRINQVSIITSRGWSNSELVSKST